MEEELIIWPDVQDNEIDLMTKTGAHKKALLQRAISVFIFNSNAEWLLQQRALTKYLSSGLWTNTSSTHPLTEKLNYKP